MEKGALISQSVQVTRRTRQLLMPWVALGVVTVLVLRQLITLTFAGNRVLDFDHPLNLAFTDKSGPGSVKWWPCEGNLECGYMIVPKDHFNAEAGTASVALLRIPATKYPKKGTVFLNPGGPGGSGVQFAKGAGASLPALMGEDWDFVGFDPRGIGLTRPRVHCFPSPGAHHLFIANTPLENGYTVPYAHNASHPANRAALTAQSRQLIALQKAQAASCAANMDVEDLRYMGTATVVRDMGFMAEMLDGPGAKINFYGWSYGTIVGAYLVNMLPERAGYVAIDGVVDPIQWANEPPYKWDASVTSSTPKTYDWFMRECAEAGPKACPLAKHSGASVRSIQDRLEDFIQSLVLDPIPVPATDATRPGVFTYGMARYLLLVSLQAPRLQPLLAPMFAHAMTTRDASALFEIAASGPGSSDLARLGVSCLDGPVFSAPSAEELADALLDGMDKYDARFTPSIVTAEADGGCQFWPATGKGPEHFTGPWNATLEYPMLVISNTADPVTPIANGLIVNAQMPNSSTMLIQNGPGHCSLGLPSLCTARAVRRYWAGNPPANGTWCEVDSSAFPSQDAEDALSVLSVEDRAVLGAAQHVGGVLAEMRLAL